MEEKESFQSGSPPRVSYTEMREVNESEKPIMAGKNSKPGTLDPEKRGQICAESRNLSEKALRLQF